MVRTVVGSLEMQEILALVVFATRLYSPSILHSRLIERQREHGPRIIMVRIAFQLEPCKYVSQPSFVE